MVVVVDTTGVIIDGNSGATFVAADDDDDDAGAVGLTPKIDKIVDALVALTLALMPFSIASCCIGVRPGGGAIADDDVVVAIVGAGDEDDSSSGGGDGAIADDDDDELDVDERKLFLLPLDGAVLSTLAELLNDEREIDIEAEEGADGDVDAVRGGGDLTRP